VNAIQTDLLTGFPLRHSRSAIEARAAEPWITPAEAFHRERDHHYTVNVIDLSHWA